MHVPQYHKAGTANINSMDLHFTMISVNLTTRLCVRSSMLGCSGERWRRPGCRSNGSTCPMCAFVAKGVDFVTYRATAAAIAGSRGKLIYSTADRRTMHALFVDRPPPPPATNAADKRRQIKCGRTEMLLLQSIKFLLQPLQPRRTRIRPVGSARGRRVCYDIASLIDCRAPCNYSTSGRRAACAAFIGYYLS